MVRAPSSIVAAFLAAIASSSLSTPLEADEPVTWAHDTRAPWKKMDASGEAPPAVLATLVQTHTDERVPLTPLEPSADRLSLLLADRVTGERIAFDPRLVELLRRLAERHPLARIELVSGYRSPKRNEMMRKKGHHVASHSQHSLGHAVDFRIVEGDAALRTDLELASKRAIDPRVLEKEIRSLGWDGGVGVYLLAGEWFVHADVGKHRRWSG